MDINTTIDDGVQVSITFSRHNMIIDSAHNAKQDSEMEDSGIADIDNTDADSKVDDGGQVSTSIDSYYPVGFDANSLQVEGAEPIDTDDDAQHIDTKCVAVSTCVANSGDHRKVVSHIFGRNKACTRDLPNDLWIFWCRKHYQRFKYRAEDSENWHIIQLGLVRNQLQTFEDWGQVRCWTITLRKAEQDALAKEDKEGITYTNYTATCWERFLVPYLGSNKTFAHVREVLDVIEGKFNEDEYRNREKKPKTFPGVEFLPFVQKAKEVKKPAVKKGEIGYKKITLDQPAFSRKTRANSQFLKDMAAKKAEASNSRKSSATPSKKGKSPDTDNNASDASTSKKRKTSPADGATNGTPHHRSNTSDASSQTTAGFRFKPLPTKRRRLTRGFEKHGSDGEDSPPLEKEDEE